MTTPQAPAAHPLGAAAGSAWFSHHCDKADDEWSGPHKHIEDALAAIVEDCDWEWGQPIYVRRGRKMKKAEIKEWGVEFQWQCDGPSIVVHLPNAKLCHGEAERKL